MALMPAVRTAGWAPVAVVLFNAATNSVGLRSELDALTHFLGGVSMAYFLLHSCRCLAPWIGELKRAGQFLVPFCMTCTVAVLWEIAEHAGGQLFGIESQRSLQETMKDLIFGVSGAGLMLLLIALTARLRSS